MRKKLLKNFIGKFFTNILKITIETTILFDELKPLNFGTTIFQFQRK